MPILVTQRLPEVGRIRVGIKDEKGQPHKLDTFRLTSKDKRSLEEAAAAYGGTVTPWQGHDGEWNLITKSNEIPVFISPEPYSQWYEMWSAGGCKRRCDGQTCSVPKGDAIEQIVCQCDPDRRECQAVTRASFVLPDLPSLGIWRLDTGSVYAAMELPAMLDLLQAARLRNIRTEATLALEIRRKIKHVSDGKGGTKSRTDVFPVVTIRIRQTVRELFGGGAGAAQIEVTATEPKAIEETRQIASKRPAEEAIERHMNVLALAGQVMTQAAAIAHVKEVLGITDPAHRLTAAEIDDATAKFREMCENDGPSDSLANAADGDSAPEVVELTEAQALALFVAEATELHYDVSSPALAAMLIRNLTGMPRTAKLTVGYIRAARAALAPLPSADSDALFDESGVPEDMVPNAVAAG